jgi:DNA-binding beta-propeller fold protein YncE
MVQHLLTRHAMQIQRTALVLIVAALAAPNPAAAKIKVKIKRPAAETLTPPADLVLEGGRKLTWERTFSSEGEVRNKPGFWARLVNVIAGEPDYKQMISPYSIAVDSRGRAIITDPGARGVHIFDFAEHKYKFLERRYKDKDSMVRPQCVAVDAQDNIYVTDSDSGKIFVFDPDGKFSRVIGSIKGGEGYFKRPTGIAVDSAAQRIYVTDTLRNQIFTLDLKDGQVLQKIGKIGTGKAEFNYPTELLLRDQALVVVDAMNFRIQFLDRSGVFLGEIGKIGDSNGEIFRPKGIAADSEGHYYVVDGLWSVVQVFDGEGRLLYYFGGRGAGAGHFQLPAGLFIDREDRVFVVDTFNRRVQVFRYVGLPRQAKGGQP